MKRLRKVLLPIDFSPVSKNAVRYANSIMENHLTEVLLVFVNTPVQSLEEPAIRKDFNEFEQEVLQEVSFKYDFIILNGNLLSELVSAADLFEVDMLILGTKSNWKSHIELASSMIRTLACPVIVVPDTCKQGKLYRIAYANDYRPLRDEEAIKPIYGFAREFSTKVHLLHVNFSYAGHLVPAGTDEDNFVHYLESLDHEWIYLAGSDMGKTINDYLKRNNIDLLVIPSRDADSKQPDAENRLTTLLSAHTDIPIIVLS